MHEKRRQIEMVVRDADVVVMHWNEVAKHVRVLGHMVVVTNDTMDNRSFECISCWRCVSSQVAYYM